MTSPFVIRHMLEHMLTKAEAEKTRKNLDNRPHFIPLDPESLAISLAGKLIIPKGKSIKDVTKEISAVIQTFISKESSEVRASELRLKNIPITKNRLTNELMAGNIPITTDNILLYTPGAVYSDGGDLVGILTAKTDAGSSAFKKIYSSIFDRFIKTKLPRYFRDSSSKSVDIGHVNTLQSNLGVSVSQEQASRVLGVIDQELVSERDLARIATLQSAKQSILSLKSSLVKNASFGTDIEKLEIIKEFTPGLIKLGVNMVIVQERYQNQTEWAQLEGKFISEVKAVIGNINFSRNVYQEIAHQVLNILSGIKVVATKAKVSLGSIKPKRTKVPVKTSPASKIRSPDTGRFMKFEPSSLMMLLNFHLHDVVAANMGNGDQRRILNYRTGRFATSTEVKSVSISRDSAVTAYYTYMKNPYATFSEGGRMEYPKTRDPKLLISKSIREIAANYAITRLRAVVV